MQRALGAALGAIAGLGFSTMGLVDTSRGFDFGGGNEATPTVIVVGVAVGAVIGAVWLWRWPFILMGLILGLAVGIWSRDNMGRGPVQAPWVFFLLFGFPVIGGACGYAIHRRTDRGVKTGSRSI